MGLIRSCSCTELSLKFGSSGLGGDGGCVVLGLHASKGGGFGGYMAVFACY